MFLSLTKDIRGLQIFWDPYESSVSHLGKDAYVHGRVL